jgi:ATP-dependent Lon protease
MTVDGNGVPAQTETGRDTLTLPLLPLNNIVIFPGMIMSLVITGESWIQLVDDVAPADKGLCVFWRSDTGEQIDPMSLGRVGTSAIISQLLRLPDGNVQVMLQGQERVEIVEILHAEPYPMVGVRVLEEFEGESLEVEALTRNALVAFKEVVELSTNLPDELAQIAEKTPSPGVLADMIAANLNTRPEQQQAVRDTLGVAARLRMVLSYLEREREILQIGQKAQEELSRSQREYVLRQQMETIRRELGDTDDSDADIAELRQQLKEARLPEEPNKEAERELKRLERLPQGSGEYSVVRTYLDWLIGLPWNRGTPDNFDLDRACDILNTDHYDLEKIKERIIEYLAVRKLKHDQGDERLRGPILCFAGPPGVGKTSLGQSIARALGREFVRVALGGVRDESEIRGFRRTYVGAMPGRIIQGISRCNSNNPVLMLDEVDKLTSSLQGDPSAALLELLDPAQNYSFVDRYLDVPFDMSRVLFICTANRTDTIPSALLDRMEVLELAGYTEMEKLVISQRYLVPRQREEQGLEGQALTICDEALKRLIREYTREAGVRNLEREIGAIYRKMATRLARGTEIPPEVDAGDLDDLLGVPRFRKETMLGEDEVGVATGLAWTPVGGDVLFIETSVVPGKGQLTLTGQLGDVMRESARAAMTYARSRAEQLGIAADFAQKYDIHVHVPAGAVPKDGPSAGITMACSLISALTRRMSYKRVAMTGEITLRGRILPIGGVKEKVLAAQRLGVTTVLIPAENGPDVRDVPEETREQIEIVLVSHMDEVLPRVLHPQADAARPQEQDEQPEQPEEQEG